MQNAMPTKDMAFCFFIHLQMNSLLLILTVLIMKQTIIIVLGLVAVSVLLMACNNKIKASKDVDFTFEKGSEFTLKNSEKTQLNKEALQIKVLEIKDSRCPVGVNCVRAGEIKFKLLLNNKGNTKEVTLAFPADSRHKDAVAFDGYNIQLVKANQPNDPSFSDEKKALLGGIFLVN